MPEHEDYADGDWRESPAPPIGRAVRAVAVAGILLLAAYLGATVLIRMLCGAPNDVFR
jgi:hypothetical protein